MSFRKTFSLIYYSHFPLVFLSMVLTGSVSTVVYKTINWQVVFLVGLSTYLTYSIDNLIDWKRDRIHYRHISGMIKIYHKFTYFLIPLSAAGIFLLVIQTTNELKIAILLLGAAVAMATTRFTNYRENSSLPSQKISGFIINRVFISVIWTMVCVFLPIWYSNLPIITRTWTSFFYMYFLVLSYAVVWKLEKGAYPLQKRVFNSSILLILSISMMIPIILVFHDIFSGLAPIYNLINLTPPIASMVGLKVIARNPIHLQKKVSLLTLVLFLLCSLSVYIHIIL